MQISYLADFPEYIPQLAKWLHEEWGYLNPYRTIEQVEHQFTNNMNYVNLPMTFIVLEEKRVIATATLILYDMDTYPQIPFWLSAVYVDSEYRNLGIGRKLVDWCTDKAKRMGVDTLYLATPDKHPWYAKMGWDAREQSIYHGYLVNLMSLKLNEERNPFLDPRYNPFESLMHSQPTQSPGIILPDDHHTHDPFSDFYHGMEDTTRKSNIII